MTESDLLAALNGAAVQFDVVDGVTVWVRPLLLADLAEYRAYRDAHPDDKDGAAVKLIELSVTYNGKPVTADEVRQLPVRHVNALVGRINDLNGWGDAAKNS